MGESILGAGEGKNRAARQRSTPHTRTERVSSPLVFFVTLRSPPAAAMSDEEYYEEEEVTSNTSKKGDGNFLKARQEAKKGELDEQLREYINEWRKQRSKEEEELKRLKEKQAKRKEIRAEQEKKLAKKKEEEERLRKEEADKKAKEAEEKRKRLEEAEKKRKSPSPSASSPLTWTPWMVTNLQTKLPSYGIPLSASRLKNTILKNDRRDRTTISKSSRRDKSNSSDRRP